MFANVLLKQSTKLASIPARCLSTKLATTLTQQWTFLSSSLCACQQYSNLKTTRNTQQQLHSDQPRHSFLSIFRSSTQTGYIVQDAVLLHWENPSTVHHRHRTFTTSTAPHNISPAVIHSDLLNLASRCSGGTKESRRYMAAKKSE